MRYHIHNQFSFLSLSQVCKCLRKIILDSVPLQYRMELASSSLSEYPHPNFDPAFTRRSPDLTTTADQLDSLKQFKSRWSSFSFKDRTMYDLLEDTEYDLVCRQGALTAIYEDNQGETCVTGQYNEHDWWYTLDYGPEGYDIDPSQDLLALAWYVETILTLGFFLSADSHLAMTPTIVLSRCNCYLYRAESYISKRESLG
jgi:hypothetical protein